MGEGVSGANRPLIHPRTPACQVIGEICGGHSPSLGEVLRKLLLLNFLRTLQGSRKISRLTKGKPPAIRPGALLLTRVQAEFLLLD